MNSWSLLEVQGCVFCVDGDEKAVAQVHPTENQQANARLIAAAPEMLEALRKLSFAAQTAGGVAGRDEFLVQAIETASQTIAKATGAA